MTTRLRGTCSLLELLTVLLVLASAATVIVPRWVSGRMLENEAEAVEVLRRVHAAQEAFHRRTGTHGVLDELVGITTAREVPIHPAVLSAPMARAGILRAGGYLVAVHLATEDGGGTLLSSELDPDSARRFWVAYAWPAQYGVTGRRTFAITRDGRVFAHGNASDRFSGYERMPFAGLLGDLLGPDAPLRPPAPWVERLRWEPVRHP